MSDDEPLPAIAPAEAAGTAHYAETLLYDFGKYLTSLALLVLGGVLSLADRTALRAPDARLSLTLVLGTIALAAICGLSVAGAIVNARARGGMPPRPLRPTVHLGMLSLGVGVGTFMSGWIKR